MIGIDDETHRPHAGPARPGVRGETALDSLRGQLDISRVAFTDRGSRLMVQREGDGLGIRMADRDLANGFAEDRHRLPAIIRSLQPTDTAGGPLPFTAIASPHVVELATSAGPFQLVFADEDTIVVQLPPGGGGLRFEAQGELCAAGVRGKRLLSLSGNRPLQISPEPRGAALECRLAVDAGEGQGVAFSLRQVSSAPDAEVALGEAKARWSAWFEAAPAVGRYHRAYYYAWWLMAANLISPRGKVTREAMVPSKLKYIGIWHWDALFHALAYRHADLDLAMDQLRLLVDHQQPDGMLPDVVHDGGLVVEDEHQGHCPVTKPPLIAWTACRLYESGAPKSFLAELYEPMARWTDWWLGNGNDSDGDGIAQYNHVWSSGLDDSPLWDGGMPVESPDLSSYLCVQMQSMAEIAATLGRDEAAETWRRRADALGRLLVRHFYDQSDGAFWAQRDHRPIRVLTPFNLLPLWTGAPAADQVAAALAHLTSPCKLWTPFPVPTVARDDPSHDGNRMWRGPVWINANYLLVMALERAGHSHLATVLTERTLDLVARQPDIGEYYNPETGAVPEAAVPAFGWSAALFIDLLLRLERRSSSSR